MSGDSVQQSLAEQVSDPEDFNRKERFREIHQARKRVTQFIADINLEEQGGTMYDDQQVKLRHLVALYILELAPLLEESSTYTRGEFVADIDTEAATLREYAMHSWARRDASAETAMALFAAANRFYARIGMDLDIDEESSEAVGRYSDILDGDVDGDDITTGGAT